MRSNLSPEEIKEKVVIEVGSLDVNGSSRPLIQALMPRMYVGVDIQMGPGVDVVCDANDLDKCFGYQSFDVVISTELLEHVRDWRRVVHNLKCLLKIGGVILLTTRSYGFRYHSYPHDFWRYEPSDFREIFSDFTIEALERDPIELGVFLRARKPISFLEKNLENYTLYSVIRDRRIHHITNLEIQMFRMKYSIQLFFTLGTRAPGFIRRRFKKLLHRLNSAK